MSKTIKSDNYSIEIASKGDLYLGIGKVVIDGVTVREKDLLALPYFATLGGIEYKSFRLNEVKEEGKKVIISTTALGTYCDVAAVLDHSLDPVWSTKAWNCEIVAEDELNIIIEPATKKIRGAEFKGFKYQLVFSSKKNEIYYILDRASWEINGTAVGNTLLRQSMGGDPKVTFTENTEYSSAGNIPFPLNPIMTHDVPRWASEQGFDYQYNKDVALIGFFDNCGLIRAIVSRDAKDTNIRHLDKHIFDQGKKVKTVKKFIGITKNVGDYVDHLNLWTGVFDADQDNVLSEFGMERTYARTTASWNFWNNFDSESYRDDLIPAAAALAFQQVFIDPIWENDMTRLKDGTFPTYNLNEMAVPYDKTLVKDGIITVGGNMCCPHEYEVAKVLGGIKKYKKLAEDARELGIEIISWIGSHQSFLSPYLRGHRKEIIKQMDGRHYYGSGYDEIYGMDLTSPFGDMFEECVARGHKDTTISGFLYDSFYNFAWMPVNFQTVDHSNPKDNDGVLKAHTQWKRLAKMMAYWQKQGLHMLIESLGPWGQPQHGVQGAYNRPGNEALAYQCTINVGYSVIPTNNTSSGKKVDRGPQFYYHLLALKAPSSQGLFYNDAKGKSVRIDKTPAAPFIKQSNLDYRAVLEYMHTRTILKGEKGVMWDSKDNKTKVLFAFKPQSVKVAKNKKIFNQTTGQDVVLSGTKFEAVAYNTYVIK